VQANSLNNQKFFIDNYLINNNVLKSAFENQIPNFVNLLSTCIFPNNNITYPLTADQIDNGAPHPSNYGYSYAKRLSGYETNIFKNLTNLNWINVVPTNVYGPHDNFHLENSHMIPGMIHRAYLAKKNARIAAQLETAIWQGDATGATGNLNKFDGLIKLIDPTAIDANVTGFTGLSAVVSTITQSNVVAATEGIYKAIPVQVLSKGDVKIFVGNDWYRLLILAYREKNMFSYNPQDSQAASFILPATNVEVVSVNGLNGTGDAYAISLSNIAMAVDLVDEETSYKLWFSEDNNDVRYRVEFKMGVNVAFPTEAVAFKAAI
jgi:hypothetical protein